MPPTVTQSLYLTNFTPQPYPNHPKILQNNMFGCKSRLSAYPYFPKATHPAYETKVGYLVIPFRHPLSVAIDPLSYPVTFQQFPTISNNSSPRFHPSKNTTGIHPGYIEFFDCDGAWQYLNTNPISFCTKMLSNQYYLRR